MPEALAPGATVAYVGLGRMGIPLSGRLVAAGYDVRAYDQLDAARATFAERTGAIPTETLVAAATGAEALILMLPDSEAVRAVLATDGLLDALAPGALILDMGSSDPVQTRALAPLVGAHGLTLVDAPVSGGVVGAEKGTLTIMVGGPAEAVERCNALLSELGRVVPAGSVGSGHALKALNNLLSAAHLLASCEAIRVGTRFGLDPATMVEAINGSTGRSYSTEYKLPTFVLPGSYTAGFALQLMDKDIRTAVSVARATRTATPLADEVAACWHAAAESLAPDADHTEIAVWLEQLQETS